MIMRPEGGKKNLIKTTLSQTIIIVVEITIKMRTIVRKPLMIKNNFLQENLRSA